MFCLLRSRNIVSCADTAAQRRSSRGYSSTPESHFLQQTKGRENEMLAGADGIESLTRTLLAATAAFYGMHWKRQLDRLSRAGQRLRVGVLSRHTSNMTIHIMLGYRRPCSMGSQTQENYAWPYFSVYLESAFTLCPAQESLMLAYHFATDRYRKQPGYAHHQHSLCKEREKGAAQKSLSC